MHAYGIGFQAVLTLERGPGLQLLPGLGAPRSVPAVIRLSPSFGLPRRLPDFLGVAIKLPDVHGPGRDQDLLLVSSLRGHATKYLPVPARRYSWPVYSSILPYRSAGRLVLPGALGASPGAAAGDDVLAAAARAAAQGTLRFRLAVAPARGRFLPLGELRGEQRLAQDDVQALRFNPFHTAESLVPAGGPLNGMRAAAYPASQRARPDTP